MLALVNSSVYTPGVTEGMTSATRRAEILSAAAELFAARVYQGSSADHARAAAHAVFGLLNSSPRSAGSLGREAMTPLLHAMADQAFTAAFGSTGARRGPT